MMNGRSNTNLLGFRNGLSSAHTSRTMMLGELAIVLENVPATARPADYQTAIVRENILGKSTQTTRVRSAKRLAELYSLDSSCTLFRLLRHFWQSEAKGRPMLAFLAATARDPLLREATPFILAIPSGQVIDSGVIADHLKQAYPNRFKASTLRSTAQNLASSWTQAGFLAGKLSKRRVKPEVTPAVVAFAVVMGHLRGIRGKLLLDSTWTRFLDRTSAQVFELVTEASRQGWLTAKTAGSVTEITFPGLLTPQEERTSNESD